MKARYWVIVAAIVLAVVIAAAIVVLHDAKAVVLAPLLLCLGALVRHELFLNRIVRKLEDD